jgi:DHA1 family tetracycline resistance protein-like MFS transporter
MTQRSPGKHALAFIFITVLVDTIGFGVTLPVLPGLIMHMTGETVGQAAGDGGWLAFVFALMQFFCAPILGGLSDRFGRRPVLLFSLAAFGVDYFVMGFAPTLGWLFVGRALAGMAGASFTPAYAYVADISPPEKRAQNFGLMGAGFGVGFILGPALGGLLGELGPRAPFFAAAILALANFIYGFFVLPETLAPASRRAFDWKRANPLGTLVQLRKYPMVFGLCGAMFLWQLGHQSLPGTWAYYAIYKFGWSEAAVGASLAAVGIIMAISQAFLSRTLIPRLGERRATAIGFAVAIGVYAAYAFATQGWMVYVAMIPWLIAALAYPSLNAIMSQQVPASAQGELQGGVASLYSLSSIAGPLMMTQLFGYFSSAAAPVHFPGAAFLCAALLTCASLLLFLQAIGFDVSPVRLPVGGDSQEPA